MRFSAQATAALLLSLGSLLPHTNGLPFQPDDKANGALYNTEAHQLADGHQGYRPAFFPDQSGHDADWAVASDEFPQDYEDDDKDASFHLGAPGKSDVAPEYYSDSWYQGGDAGPLETRRDRPLPRTRVAVPNPFTMTPKYYMATSALDDIESEDMIAEYPQYDAIWATETYHNDVRGSTGSAVDCFSVNKAGTGIAIWNAYNNDAAYNKDLNSNNVRLAEMVLGYWQHKKGKAIDALKFLDIISIANEAQIAVINAALKTLGQPEWDDDGGLEDKAGSTVILKASAKAGTKEHEAYQKVLTGKPFGPMVTKMLTNFVGTENLRISQFEISVYHTALRMIVRFS